MGRMREFPEHTFPPIYNHTGAINSVERKARKISLQNVKAPLHPKRKDYRNELYCKHNQNMTIIFARTLPALLSNSTMQFWSLINPKPILAISPRDGYGSPFSQCSVAETLNSIFPSVFSNELEGEMPEYPHLDYQLMPDLRLPPVV